MSKDKSKILSVSQRLRPDKSQVLPLTSQVRPMEQRKTIDGHPYRIDKVSKGRGYRILAIRKVRTEAEERGYRHGYEEGLKAGKQETKILTTQQYEKGWQDGYQLSETEHRFEVEEINIEDILDEGGQG